MEDAELRAQLVRWIVRSIDLQLPAAVPLITEPKQKSSFSFITQHSLPANRSSDGLESLVLGHCLRSELLR